jgi:mannose-6-phosphate isomerase-like protein (cupin superfamily)
MTEGASHPEDLNNRHAGEFFTPERCWIQENWNTPSDPAVSIARARVEVGVQTQLHRLRGVDERYLVIDGVGGLEIRGAPGVEVRRGDVVMIPSGMSQQIRNVGVGQCCIGRSPRVGDWLGDVVGEVLSVCWLPFPREVIAVAVR